MLIADLVITDPATIQDVLDGKREISCGYNYDLCEENGKFVQRQIRGNHIAIVDRGRAGHRVCIKDSAPNNERRTLKMAKTRHGILAKMFAAFAKDAAPDEIAEAAGAIDEILAESPDTEAPATADEVPEKLDTVIDLLKTNLAGEKEDEQEDCDPVEAQKDDEPDKQDIIIDLLKQLVAKSGKDEEPEEADPIKELEDDLDEIEAKAEEAEDDDDEDEIDAEDEDEDEEGFAPDEDPSEPESHFVDPEEINEMDEDETDPDEEKATDHLDKKACDAMRAALRAVKPVIAALPENKRKAAADAAVKSIRKSYGMTGKPTRNDYIRISQRKRTGDSAAKKQMSNADLAKRIMASRNVNYKK